LRFQDLAGLRFGRLIVRTRAGSERAGPNATRATWNCDCDCGAVTVVPTDKLKNGNTRSCGCLLADTKRKHGHAADKAPSPTYSSYRSMLNRCFVASSPAHAHYKKLGITVCDRWRFGRDGRSGFECFLADMGQRPSLKHSLDRHPNQTGNYEPSNCRWATKSEQGNNRSTNRLVTFRGRQITVTELARETKLPYELLRHRISRAGWPIERAVNTPPRQKIAQR
jgi:hypothetical protein